MSNSEIIKCPHCGASMKQYWHRLTPLGGDRSHGYNEALDDMVEIINQVRRETAEKSKAEIELLRDVAKQVGKVMGNGTFRVETINESILWKMLQRVGIELPIEKELRDIEKDWDKYLSNIKG